LKVDKGSSLAAAETQERTQVEKEGEKRAYVFIQPPEIATATAACGVSNASLASKVAMSTARFSIRVRIRFGPFRLLAGLGL
jgi:hypothetical protein